MNLEKLLALNGKIHHRAHVNHIKMTISKVLVVITDKGSGLSSSDIEKAAEPLRNRGVKVVPVAVGAEASPSELISTNPAHQFVIEAPRDEDPQRLGQQIMENVVRRESFLMVSRSNPSTTFPIYLLLFPFNDP